VLVAKAKVPPVSEEDFLKQIDARRLNIPNCKVGHRAVIKAGPEHYKAAVVLNFANATTGEVTHRELRLNSYPHERGRINFQEENRLARWACRDGEINRLRMFLNMFEGIDTVGTHRVVPANMAAAFDEFVQKLGAADLQTSQLLDLICALAEHASEIKELPELGETDKLRMVAAAIRVVHRTKALERLAQLINGDAVEAAFQKLLDQNWWMLGSQYIEHIPRRDWTTGETIDIMLRTADNYFEIIELKRSSPELFRQDHGKWIVSGEVNTAVNQAAHYIAEIERIRPAIFQKYEVDLYKLKAKVLLGFVDDDDDKGDKCEALRMYNSHLHRIEVITYDQLIRISENVIAANVGESGQDAGNEGTESEAGDNDIPF
jgi:Domain of unknown function (DUF4263)